MCSGISCHGPTDVIVTKEQNDFIVSSAVNAKAYLSWFELDVRVGMYGLRTDDGQTLRTVFVEAINNFIFSHCSLFA